MNERVDEMVSSLDLFLYIGFISSAGMAAQVTGDLLCLIVCGSLATRSVTTSLIHLLRLDQLDLNPLAWSGSANLTLDSALDQILVFANSHLALRHENQIALFAATNSSASVPSLLSRSPHVFKLRADFTMREFPGDNCTRHSYHHSQKRKIPSKQNNREQRNAGGRGTATSISHSE